MGFNSGFKGLSQINACSFKWLDDNYPEYLIKCRILRISENAATQMLFIFDEQRLVEFDTV